MAVCGFLFVTTVKPQSRLAFGVVAISDTSPAGNLVVDSIRDAMRFGGQRTVPALRSLRQNRG